MWLEALTVSLPLSILEMAKGLGISEQCKFVFESHDLLSGYELICSSDVSDWTSANLALKEKKKPRNVTDKTRWCNVEPYNYKNTEITSSSMYLYVTAVLLGAP